MRLSLPLAAAMLAGCACLVAAPPFIGSVAGAGSLSDGAALSASAMPTDIHLASGVEVHLSPGSQSVIYRDHAVLDGGSLRVDHFLSYSVSAGPYRIHADSPTAEAVVRMSEKTIEVASLGGALRVSDGGAMLTRVAAGTRLSFQQSGASPGQTGAAPFYRKTRPNHHVLYWVIGATAAAALAIGLTAAAQGKSL